MCQKWEGDCGVWILNEIILKKYAESLKKIVGAIFSADTKTCRNSKFCTCFPHENMKKTSSKNPECRNDFEYIKVSKFQNEVMKSSFLPKYEPKIVGISPL